MATRTPTALYDGQLSNAKTTLYTATTRVYITGINVVNTSATPQTVELWLNRAGGSRYLRYVESLAQNECIEIGSGHILESGDLIEGKSTTAAVSDCMISGIVET